jgi:hypothetical protein
MESVDKGLLSALEEISVCQLADGFGPSFPVETEIRPLDPAFESAGRIGLPESLPWLETQGRDLEAEQAMTQIETDVRREIGRDLPDPQPQVRPPIAGTRIVVRALESGVSGTHTHAGHIQFPRNNRLSRVRDLGARFGVQQGGGVCKVAAVHDDHGISLPDWVANRQILHRPMAEEMVDRSLGSLHLNLRDDLFPNTRGISDCLVREPYYINHRLVLGCILHLLGRALPDENSGAGNRTRVLGQPPQYDPRQLWRHRTT